MKHDQACRRQLRRLATPLLLLLLTTSQESAGQSQNHSATRRIGLRKQLLVDDFVIDKMQDLTRELGRVTKQNGGKPIFTEGRFYGTVLHDAGRFKMWYRLPGSKGYAYADSLRFRLRWKGASDLSALQGKTIRLKFHLRRSKLYAFQIVSSKEKEK